MGGLRTIKSPNTSASPNAADFANGICPIVTNATDAAAASGDKAVAEG
jgi:hypothetical protein